MKFSWMERLSINLFIVVMAVFGLIVLLVVLSLESLD
jgi:hypothetical protein